MVSLDPPDRNRAFGESAGSGFPVLSDPEGVTARAYGVLAPGGSVSRRWTFAIDAMGVIRHIDRGVNPKTHGRDLVDSLESLGLERDSP